MDCRYALIYVNSVECRDNCNRAVCIVDCRNNIERGILFIPVLSRELYNSNGRVTNKLFIGNNTVKLLLRTSKKIQFVLSMCARLQNKITSIVSYSEE